MLFRRYSTITISIRKKLDIQINSNNLKDKKISNGASNISNTESMNIEDEKTKDNVPW